ncbi:cytochrome b5-like heme/steroid binding domain-containing protein [Schizophyllum amplum]|uniref:Cytochrome b5-like heme/steroid binding domain-containing protein n=1 Tax=Schizophyllum amplum TaxID=97359 RepID=A0A550CUR2_9AGAR|nr:cytochrome b5-like heme/steroid binding domain-containing protein [Auriculariopsis ampla]
MSWLGDFAPGAEPRQPYREVDDTPKVPDPSIPGRMVSTKKANQPFLAYKDYRDRQQKAHEAWAERKKERDAKLARGESVGPEEPDPTVPQEISVLSLMRGLLYVVILFLLAGKFFTGSFVWGYDGKWVHMKTYTPDWGTERLFTDRSLAQYDGSVPGRPVYLAIDGEVYDVSKGSAYRSGGSYSFFAGKDAARAYGTGCFKTHLTHDLRGLTESEFRGVQHWKDFYKDHKDYWRIGRVIHEPIDPSSPIPEHCKAKRANTDKKDADGDPFMKDTAERGAAPPPKQPRKKKSEKVQGEL